MRKATEVKPLAGYRLHVQFDDGVQGEIDLSDALRDWACAEFGDSKVCLGALCQLRQMLSPLM